MTFQIDAFQNDAFQHVHVIPGPSLTGRKSGQSRSTQTTSRKQETGKTRTSTGTQRRNHGTI